MSARKQKFNPKLPDCSKLSGTRGLKPAFSGDDADYSCFGYARYAVALAEATNWQLSAFTYESEPDPNLTPDSSNTERNQTRETSKTERTENGKIILRGLTVGKWVSPVGNNLSQNSVSLCVPIDGFNHFVVMSSQKKLDNRPPGVEDDGYFRPMTRDGGVHPALPGYQHSVPDEFARLLIECSNACYQEDLPKNPSVAKFGYIANDVPKHVLQSAAEIWYDHGINFVGAGLCKVPMDCRQPDLGSTYMPVYPVAYPKYGLVKYTLFAGEDDNKTLVAYEVTELSRRPNHLLEVTNTRWSGKGEEDADAKPPDARMEGETEADFEARMKFKHRWLYTNTLLNGGAESTGYLNGNTHIVCGPNMWARAAVEELRGWC